MAKGDAVWRRFQLADDKSNKFWEICQEGADYRVRYGRIGTNGQERVKSFDSEEQCGAAVEKIVAEKIRKGYAEVAPGSGAPARNSGSPGKRGRKKAGRKKSRRVKKSSKQAAATPLWKAVSERELERVRELLAQGANPNEVCNGITTFEHAIADSRHDEILLALFDAGADPTQVSSPRKLNLVWAAITGRVDVVRGFVEAGAPVNVKAVMGTPLEIAAERGHIEIVRLLIEAGADLDAGSILSTPLSESIDKGQPESALTLLEAGASVDPELCRGKALAARAAQQGMSDVLRALASAGADLEARETFSELDETAAMERITGQLENLFEEGGGSISLLDPSESSVRYDNATPLMIAAGDGHADCVEVLLSAGVELDALDDSGKCAVEHARERGHEALAQRLIRAGAAPTAQRPPELRLLLAVQAGDLTEVRAALEAGSAPDTHDRREEQEGRTPLMLAALEGHAEIVEALLAAGADVNRADDAEGEARPNGRFMMRSDSRGRTALLLAASAGNAPIVRLLLAAAADHAHRDAEKETALTLAAGAGDTAVVGVLLEAGADVDLRGAGRCTPLHCALSEDHGETAIALIDAGAKLDLKDGEGQAALHIAALMNDRAAVERLLEAGANPTLLNREKERPRESAWEGDELKALLRRAETAWEALAEARGGAAPEKEDDDPEEARAAAARQRTPQVKAPSVASLEKRYDPETVRERLTRACEAAGFQALVPEIAEACGSEATDEREEIGGYLFPVRTGKLDLDGLEALQGRMLERGAFVCCCGQGTPWGSPGRLLVLPTRDRFDALAVLGTNGVNEDKTLGDILRWLMQREQTHPFVLTWVEHDTLQGRFTGPIEDPEELAYSMYDLCSDIVHQGTETVEALTRNLAETQRLYFWWD